jgi:hypothetical protein
MFTPAHALRAHALVVALATSGLASSAFGGPAEHDHAEHVKAAPALPKEMEILKKMVGRWGGKAKMGNQEMPVTIVYELTAGGTTVLERLFPGTPHEMISVYTAEADKLVMTHYCAMGNHPKMTLKQADAKSLAFEMKGNEGLRAPGEPHMHAMSVAFVDPDHVRESWTSFETGGKKSEKLFELARQK